MSDTYQNIEHLIALSQILTEREPHSKARVLECKRRWLIELEGERSKYEPKLSLADMALKLMIQILGTTPARVGPTEVTICQN